MREDINEALQEERAEDLYDNAPCGYLSTLPSGLIIKVNQTFLDWTGFQREELLGRRLQDLLSMGGRMFYETHYAPLLRMQGFINEVNFELTHKEGHRLPVLVNSVQRQDADGKHRVTRTTLFNISERKNYERELLIARNKAEQATRAKADFLSMMSHEIRTPMNALIGLSHLLGRTVLSAQQQQYVDLLRSSSENLLGLINNILDFSKIEAGKVALEERPFDVRQLVYGVFYTLNLKAEEKGLAVRVELDEQLPAFLMGDPIKLGQVLTNLLGNAIKFTEQGCVTLALRVQELQPETVRLAFQVSDTGIGIPAERLPRIFEEFTQASYDIGLKFGGSGLGLTISQKLLALHGSRLEVRSEPGQGSCFSFSVRLRRAQQPAKVEAHAKSPANTQTLEGIRVLLAEDNAVNVFVLSQFLRNWEACFDVVGTGSQALESVQRHEYDVVLMDLQMPEMDGTEATRLIRALPEERFGRLPIIALTASHDLELKQPHGSVGFTDFITKPFRPEDLFARLALHGGRATAAPRADRPKAGAVPGPRALAPGEPSQRFSLQGFEELAGGSPQAFVELGTLAIDSCEQYKHAFSQALESGDPADFRFHFHKITWTVDLLHAHALRAALEQGRDFLEQERREAARGTRVLHALHRELDALSEALREAVGQAAQGPAPGSQGAAVRPAGC